MDSNLVSWINWAGDYAKLAVLDGWNIHVHKSGQAYRIRREPSYHFADNSEAASHVVKRAKEGSRMHVLALAVCYATTEHVIRVRLANGSIV